MKILTMLLLVVYATPVYGMLAITTNTSKKLPNGAAFIPHCATTNEQQNNGDSPTNAELLTEIKKCTATIMQLLAHQQKSDLFTQKEKLQNTLAAIKNKVPYWVVASGCFSMVPYHLLTFWPVADEGIPTFCSLFAGGTCATGFYLYKLCKAHQTIKELDTQLTHIETQEKTINANTSKNN